MIAPEVIDSIRRLLAEGRVSQRQIAGQVGVSRGTVARVASGRRTDREPIRRGRDYHKQPSLLGPVVRCSTCGGMVHIPCTLCAARWRLAHGPRPVAEAGAIEPLGIELHGGARARYEAIHRRRMEEGEPPEQWKEDWS